jgi:hypothetical protein
MRRRTEADSALSLLATRPARPRPPRTTGVTGSSPTRPSRTARPGRKHHSIQGRESVLGASGQPAADPYRSARSARSPGPASRRGWAPDRRRCAPGVGDWVTPCDRGFGDVGHADRLERGRSLPRAGLAGTFGVMENSAALVAGAGQGIGKQIAPARWRRLRPLYIAGRGSGVAGCGALACRLRVCRCCPACSVGPAR